MSEQENALEAALRRLREATRIYPQGLDEDEELEAAKMLADAALSRFYDSRNRVVRHLDGDPLNNEIDNLRIES
jgi:hypothetical protein